MTEKKSFLSKRKTALLITTIIFIALFVLLRLEQIAVIYVLATLGLVVLLLVVSFADLEKVGRENAEN
jgi:phosphatidylglycerophosphate synthase